MRTKLVGDSKPGKSMGFGAGGHGKSGEGFEFRGPDFSAALDDFKNHSG